MAVDASGPGLPLAGIRIIDLTHVWSGPMATRVLAGLGAEVIKVEGPNRPDFLRGTGARDVPRRYPRETFGLDPQNRNAWFNTQNTDKLSVVIDLKHPEGRELVLGLAANAHALVANMRPGVLERLGLDRESLHRANPELVIVEMPGYGLAGPYRDLAAYGAQFEALAGAATLMGGADPLITGFALADPVAGLHAALTVVAALTGAGAGRYFEVVQRDCMIATMGEYLVAHSGGQPLPADRLNGADDDALQFIVRTGDGTWVAIRSESSADLERACGGSDRCAVQGWAALRATAHEAAAVLRAAGIAASAVQDAGEVFADPDLRRRGYHVALDHPSAGRHDHPGLPYRQAGERWSPRRPAPRLDADTDAVLSQVLGLNAERLTNLRDRRIIGVPEGAAGRQ